MSKQNSIAKTLIAIAMSASLALPALSQEEQAENTVCTFDQFLPGFAFVPITLSPGVFALLGGNPDDCRTPVEDF